MGRVHSCLRSDCTWIFPIILVISISFSALSVYAITASVGRPYQGRLVNGIPFPREFRGYHLREEVRTYTTPEVIGAMLDSIDGVREQFPNAPDLYMGDFSLEGGGWVNHHKSHQNGRDVDIGMYAKGNRFLSQFIPMNQQNLDVAKTWLLIENLLSSQRVQYIFVDKSIQKLLYDYAVSQGRSPAYLDQLFGKARGGPIQHVRGHKDHIHVRFFTPWSTLAGQSGATKDKQTEIEMAQQAYLPKKVQYYIKGSESNLEVLARSFGVSRKDLCRWNRLQGNEVLNPGSCLVFYKRGFEVEPVHLAQSLQPNLALDTQPIRLAALESKSLRDLAPAPRNSNSNSGTTKTKEIRTTTAKVKKGDSLWSVAKRAGTDLQTLCRLNGIKKNAVIRPGQKLIVSKVEVQSSSNSRSNSKASTQKSASRSRSDKSTATKATTYSVQSGDTLWSIAARNGMPLESLCEMNGITKNSTLKLGQKLQLVSAKRDRTQAKTTPKSSSTPPQKTTKVSKKSKKVHTVKNGENLWALARRYGTTTQTICQLNSLSAKAVLQPGMKISVP